MATSQIAVTEGTSKNVATHAISESAVTKQIQRVAINTSAGVDVATFPVSAASGSIASGAIAAGAMVAGSAVDGHDLTLGVTTGAAVVTDATGTIQQYLRGLVKQAVDVVAGEYETVAASATNQAMGATGATADYLEAVLIVPATVNPGAVTIKDGANGAITIFAGGTASVADLAPIYVPLAVKSTVGAWQITTGTNVSAIGIGNFT